MRNFINARLMTINALLDAVQEGVIPDESCLLIPNLFVTKASAATQQGWRAALLMDALVARHAAGLQTVLYASDMTSLGTHYGVEVKDHVESLYSLVGVK